MLILQVAVATLVLLVSSEGLSTDIKLDNNKYDGVVIAINPEIPQDSGLIQGIKDLWVEASKDLWIATENRAYFGEITIIVPKTWTGSYADAQKLSYSTADILVANPNPQYGDSPYTVQYGQCGEPGEYIHLTPNYIKDADVSDDYGAEGKTMVHEWAHLRWGIFDEIATDGYDPFYFDYASQAPQATRSPVSIQGENYVVDFTTGAKRKCQISWETNYLPENGCMFFPYEDQESSASIMSFTNITNINTFDTDEPGVNQHNKDSPSEHNRLCNQRSEWDVILSSEDFKANANRPNPAIANVEPTFRLVQWKNLRSVLVLDVSGSMGSGTRFPDMIAASSLFINSVLEESEVGIVEFSSSAEILSNLVKIRSDSDRHYLIDRLPNHTGGSTGVADGILKAIEVLEQNGHSAAGGHIIVLINGEETGPPLINDIRKEVLKKNVYIDTIFFGSAPNADLQDLSAKSGGAIFYSGYDVLIALMESFKELVADNDCDVNNQQFQIYGESFSLSPSETVSGQVKLDSTIGKETTFVFAWSLYEYEPVITLRGPDGRSYGGAQVDKVVKTVTYKIPGVAEGKAFHVNTGETSALAKHAKQTRNLINWDSVEIIERESNFHKRLFLESYRIDKTRSALNDKNTKGKWNFQLQAGTHSQKVSLVVTSKAADANIPPLVVESGMGSLEISSSGTPMVVYAKVSADHQPILGAIVEATISHLDGSQTVLSLEDNGSAPDVRRCDGVYSKYFTDFSGNGRYGVQVTVTGLGNDCSNSICNLVTPESRAPFIYGYISSSGELKLIPNTESHAPPQGIVGTSTKDIEPFSRIVSPGRFSYSRPSGSSGDQFPPSRILDLTVKQVDPLDVTKGVQLTFIAPGDDFDSGKASRYEIRYLFENSSLLSTDFGSGNLVSNDKLIKGDLTKPSIAGTVEEFIYNLTNIPNDKDLLIVGFAVISVDDTNNVAETSNVAVMNLFLAPPAVACSDKSGNPSSSDPFEKTGDCFNFYQCSNGELNTISCKDNTVFNPLIGVCDHPYNVPKCAGKVNPQAPTSSSSSSPPTSSSAPSVITTTTASSVDTTCQDSAGKSTNTGPFEKPGDCTHFYQCSNGNLMVLSCPPGLVFNPKTITCDWQYNVPGC